MPYADSGSPNDRAPAPRVTKCVNEMPHIDRIVVLHDYSTARGGASTLAVEAVRQYRKLGLPVTMFTGEAGNEDLRSRGVEIVALGAKPLLEESLIAALAQGYHRNETAERLRAWIAANDTPNTIYHMNNWSQTLSPSVFAALRKVASRTVITCHDYFNTCPNGAFLHFGRSKPCELKPLSLGCTFSQCDRRNSLHKVWRVARQHHLNAVADFGRSPYTFSFIHERMRDRFGQAGFPVQNATVIRNPVQPWTRKRITAEKNSRFLFVGRIGREKGADLALEATARENLPLTLIGRGELVDAGRENYPHAKFMGWVPRNKIFKSARWARALVVPSRWAEPFGLVILEAAMSGLPVIISDQASLADEIDTNGFGKSFALDDPDSLIEALKLFAANDDYIARMSEAGYASAHTLCHSPGSWAEAHIDLFGKILSA